MTNQGLQAILQDTLQRVRQATKESLSSPSLRKVIDVSTGLVGINLEAPAKQLVPLLSPFRQRIPRSNQPGSNAIDWKQITAVVQNAKFSAAESASSNPMATTLSSKTKSYKIVGVRGLVTREAVAHSVGFDDAKAKEVSNNLLLFHQLQERRILGGNVTALATPSGVAVAVRDTIGTIAASAGGYDVQIAALTLEAAGRLGMDRPAAFDGTDSLRAGNGHAGVTVDVATDGVTVGSGIVTSAATVGGDDALKITWNAVPDAVAYAVYIIANGGGTPKLEAIVTQTLVTITSLAGTGHDETDLTGTSADTLAYEGIIQGINANATSFKKVLNGPLTSSGQEIPQIQEMFQAIWDSGKIDDLELLVGGIDSRSLSSFMVKAGGGPQIFVSTSDIQSQASLTAGYHVGWIINAVSGKRVLISVLPWLPGGTIICLPTRIPYPDANITVPFALAGSYGPEQIDYAATSTSGPVDEFEVRSEEVLKDYFPAGSGLISDIHFDLA